PGRKLFVADLGRNPDVKLLDEEFLHLCDQPGRLVSGRVRARRDLAQLGHAPFQLIRHRIVLRAIRPTQSDPSGPNRRDTLATDSSYDGFSEMSRRANLAEHGVARLPRDGPSQDDRAYPRGRAAALDRIGTDHPLAVERREGITRERVQGIAELVLHGRG